MWIGEEKSYTIWCERGNTSNEEKWYRYVVEYSRSVTQIKSDLYSFTWHDWRLETSMINLKFCFFIILPSLEIRREKLTEWGTGCIDDSEKFLIKILLRNHLPLFKAFAPWRNGKSLFQKAETDMTTSGELRKLLLHDEAPAMRILIDRRPYEF